MSVKRNREHGPRAGEWRRKWVSIEQFVRHKTTQKVDDETKGAGSAEDGPGKMETHPKREDETCLWWWFETERVKLGTGVARHGTLSIWEEEEKERKKEEGQCAAN